MCAQTVVISGGCYGGTQELLVFIHTFNKGGQEDQELGILAGSLSGAEEVFAGVCRQRPVVVLTGTVYTLEGLFVEQADQVVLCGTLFHNLHGKLVCIAGTVGIGVDGRQFMLTGGGLVMLCLRQNAQPPKLLIQVLHKVGNPGTDRAEIVIVQLLTLGRQCTEEGAAGKPKVRPLSIQIFG